MTLSDLALLRHMTDEQTEDTYGNAFLEDLLTSAGSVAAAASQLWGMKAAKYAALVDTAEAGASRKMSQMAAQATAMAKHYADEAGGSVGGASTRVSMTRQIVRP
jgi:hypothetical protein